MKTLKQSVHWNQKSDDCVEEEESPRN